MWIKEFPNQPGMYWFYGKRFKQDIKNDLYLVKVRKISNGLVFICEGTFMFKLEVGDGMFMLVELPELPEKNNDTI